MSPSEIHFAKVAKILGMRLGTQDWLTSVNPRYIGGELQTKAMRHVQAQSNFYGRIQKDPRFSNVYSAVKSGIPSSRISASFHSGNSEGVNSESKRNVTDIRKGIETAFGGKSLKRLSKALGISTGLMGPAALVFALKRYVGMSIDQAQSVSSASWGAQRAGSSVRDFGGMAGAMSAFGGGAGQAGSFLAKINALRQGALVGKGLGDFGEAAKQYGLDITGPGPGGLATTEQIIERIANRMQRMDREEKADFASTLGIDGPLFMLLKDGFEEYNTRVKYALEGSVYANEELVKEFEYTTTQFNLLGNELDKFKTNIANTDFVSYAAEFWKDAFHSINIALTGKGSQGNGDRTNRLLLGSAALSVAEYQAGLKWYDAIGGVGRNDEQNRKYFHSIYSSGQGDYLRAHIGDTKEFNGRNGAINKWIENYDKYKSEYDLSMAKSYQSLYSPAQAYQQGLRLNLDFNGITISPEAKQEILPWISKWVINPMMRMEK